MTASDKITISRELVERAMHSLRRGYSADKRIGEELKAALSSPAPTDRAREALRALAALKLVRDWNPEGPDVIDAGMTILSLNAQHVHDARAAIAAPPSSDRAQAIEEAAKIAEGEVYYDRYRTWCFWPADEKGDRGNYARESALVKHCDKIAAAIRALAATSPKEEHERP